MILYLRDKRNRTILDVEIYVDGKQERDFVEMHSTVIIEPYSLFLIENIDNADEIIATFDELSELRGWMWENYFMVKDNKPEELNNVIKLVTERLKEVAKKFDLGFVTD